MNSGLIICPNCISKEILGSVDINGDFHILRYHSKTKVGLTTIQSSEMTISCYCGFGTTVNKVGTYATPAHA